MGSDKYGSVSSEYLAFALSILLHLTYVSIGDLHIVSLALYQFVVLFLMQNLRLRHEISAFVDRAWDLNMEPESHFIRVSTSYQVSSYQQPIAMQIEQPGQYEGYTEMKTVLQNIHEV